ncbi:MULTISPECIES: hypothetical protein [Sphingobium]|uniref:Uncharacterized protein n=1 Tax=Sphingobium lignivorans TaxID=2735886 RepID=A0ABR6NLR6_9SPHN|nr:MULTISPECIES: hypothetical protein [Sphingobium]MBB5987652.1 hypothetical protein [Sphingobium lignivorans]BAK68285.1 hypothetical protein SLG_36100 [Sphingobium sp. SYK-6]
MTDLSIIQYGAMALIVTGWIGILAYAGLKGWNGWLAFKRAELEMALGQRGAGMDAMGSATAATRIDVADLKERIRKLEAIAAGIDL